MNLMNNEEFAAFMDAVGCSEEEMHALPSHRCQMTSWRTPRGTDVLDSWKTEHGLPLRWSDGEHQFELYKVRSWWQDRWHTKWGN